MWVKICGLTEPEAVAAAVDAGADAVGFVFAKSVREVAIEQAILLAGVARGHADIVAVMRHPEADWAAEVQARLQPDWLQTDAQDYAGIPLLDGIGALPVYRDNSMNDAPSLPARLLYEGAQSGVGEVADWTRAASIAEAHQLVLAGGLAADNVAAAISAVRPWGVDVSSGVEQSPGHKDHAKISDFIQAARGAAQPI